MNVSELCIRRPVFASVLSMMLVIFGLVSLDRLALREYPDIARPVVSISTVYRGASANVVENKVTQAIEDRVAGIEGIVKVESDSEEERSSIRVEFDTDRDIDAAATREQIIARATDEAVRVAVAHEGVIASAAANHVVTR